ncbi:PhzF family phenazine biosynthesis protein [Breznakia pachnodae]|uniref:PhzF family phenazine biosynthesis protein n=1 Tax=Breznakia pachnodae TaxID=265178 RepID=A0ABU0E110_9FIRM|nr:PhzF family phenazine biosynthesis isomerase [Breznakia pachnodae]MDQ0360495.1 PhzF family phenazine biosynthesis protein [Breznakia pachnodae]
MNTYKYKKIDAFTSKNSLGNPAACIYLDTDQTLGDNEMLDIAKQHKGFVSEVIYCEHKEDSIFLTYYSSECEVDFCGHGTIACIYSLIKDTLDLWNQSEIEIQTNKKGKLTVYNRMLENDTVLISAPEPKYIGSDISREVIADNLGLTVDDLHLNHSIDLIDAGLRTLIVPLNELATEVSIFPDEQKLQSFCIQNEIDIILIFTKDTENPECIAHTRVFAPKFGYLEDPATGSGNSAFGYYMLKNKLWDGNDCIIEQGGENRVFNSIYLSMKDNKVLFGGSATIRIDGTYYY